MKRCRITTTDNKWNPFDNFTEWFLFDVEKGYNTCSKIARLSNEMFGNKEMELLSEIENEAVIDRLIELDLFDIYEKVYDK